MNEDPNHLETQQQSVSIKFNWQEEPEIPLLFTNYTFVRSQGDSFFVSFGQAEVPRRLDWDDDTKERYENEGVGIRTVARLAMSPKNVESVIKYLSDVYGNWLQEQSQKRGDVEAQ